MIELNDLFVDVDENINELMENGGILSTYIPNYQEREHQIDAVKKIIKSLRLRNNFIFEGPTGFGKSPTYLTAAILNIIESGERAIIATAGIILQEQLFYKDIPAIASAIEELTGKSIKFAYMKGRNNFVCKRKVKIIEMTESSGGETKEFLELFKWAKETKSGDNSEFSYTPKYENWAEVSCISAEDCEGKKCPLYTECFYQKAKMKAQNSDLIVTNYHLLLSDYEVGGAVLGEYDLLICDEAHEIPKIARDFTEIKLSHNTFIDIQRRISKIKNKSPKEYLPLIESLDIKDLLTRSLQFFDYLNSKLTGLIPDKADTLIALKEMNIETLDFQKYLKDFITSVFNVLNKIDSEDDDSVAVSNELESIGKMLQMATMQLDTIESGDFGDYVYWFERSKNDKKQFLIKAKLVNVGDYLKNLFFKDNFNYILTSATLSVDGSFSYIRSQLGIDADENVRELIAESPFDLTNQQLWYLPANAVDGNNRDEFLENSKENVIEIIKACKGGCLVLFTSNYNMDQCCYQARREIRNLRIYKQGEFPRQTLLDNFSSDTNSVLFGTRSFFTGIDVKGLSLRCVIVDKFPFESPTDPVTVALNKRENAFFKYSIPDMVITLKQAIGRGVRDVTDKCVVAILDNRLATARYKGKINNSFNYEKTATRNIKDVENYINNYIEENKKI